LAPAEHRKAGLLFGQNGFESQSLEVLIKGRPLFPARERSM